MKKSLENYIKKFVREYPKLHNTSTKWKEPIIGYASAHDPLFEEYKTVIGQDHITPLDALISANTVISYFIPFQEETVESNASGKMASKDWAFAYVETNRLLDNLAIGISEKLKNKGYDTVVPTEREFIKETMTSNYSQRHVAYVAGLGTFGINNMLITEQGCAGRFGSVVTELKIQQSPRPEQEYCLYKTKKSCTACVDACPVEALQVDSFDREKCYAQLEQNQKIYKSLGSCEVCGKCIAYANCKYKKLG